MGEGVGEEDELGTTGCGRQGGGGGGLGGGVVEAPGCSSSNCTFLYHLDVIPTLLFP